MPTKCATICSIGKITRPNMPKDSTPKTSSASGTRLQLLKNWWIGSKVMQNQEYPEDLRAQGRKVRDQSAVALAMQDRQARRELLGGQSKPEPGQEEQAESQ